MIVYDYMNRATPAQLAEMKARGATGVVRYLDPYNPKCIQKGEDVEIHSAGLELHLVFEIGGAGPFTFPDGVQDCMDAEKLISERLTNPPKHLRVYFAADVNLEPSLFDPYANGIESAKTDAIDTGVYGYQRLIEWAAHNYPHFTGRWQTYGTPTVPLDLWQHEQITLDSGLTVDVNEAWVHGWSGDQMTDDDLKAALKRIYAGPDSLEEWVKADVRVMVEQDPETRDAISTLGHPTKYVPHTHKTDEGAMV